MIDPQPGPLFLLLAWMLDALIGDPPKLARFHPIVWIGNLVALLEKILHSATSPVGSFLRGTLLWLLTLGTVVGVSLALLSGADKLGPNYLLALEALLAWACIATGDLARQVMAVAKLVRDGDLPAARRALSMIVGRDTENLPPEEIYRAAFETGAENSSDGVVAPIFYLALGGALGLGPLLGLAYKAVNTLDSMVGYKNPRYLYFGRFSARADDVANYLPARLTALFAVLLSAILWGSGLRALKTMARDAKKHSSPNSGYPEAAFAGGAGVRIGGTNVYGGVPRQSPLIGEGGGTPDFAAVKRCVTLVWAVSALTLFFGVSLIVLFHLINRPGPL